MKCPIDNTTLQMSSRDGVEIDYCPECRGVWLDRGELDKIIERSAGVSQSHVAPQHQIPVHQQYGSQQGHGHGHDDHHDSHHDDDYNKKRKKESFLGDIFDF